ncbi:MAG: leucine--tRNA ligase [Cyclobacteriaceae bacterium]
MAEYTKEEIKKIEEKWRGEWDKRGVYIVSNDTSKPKYYVLDMFPYPSGAGLHVGHPLGYIASDIVARYKRLKGFNVLHPMGFDAFGLPAEQYALEHGIHPAVSTADNINNFKKQLGSIGFSYDWSREVQTCDPKYYQWTQWIFLQIFDSWFNHAKEKAERIAELTKIFESEGNVNHTFPNSKFVVPGSGKEIFSASEWKSFNEKTQQEILMQYRLAYLAYTDVNWCEALGTVLANDEVINGVSYRGGFPVVKKQMRQWSLRITEYAERLLKGLDEIDFSESMKEIQRNWIGKSVGALVSFNLTKDSGLTPNPSPQERGTVLGQGSKTGGFETSEKRYWKYLKEFSKENRQNPTEEEEILWQELRNSKLGHKIRRQHTIGVFIADFVCLDKKLVIEVDGGYHQSNKEFDEARTEFLNDEGFKVIRFANDEVKTKLKSVLSEIKSALDSKSSIVRTYSSSEAVPLSSGEGRGEANNHEARTLSVFTTRPDTIFGVDFMVIAPEHDLVKQITTEAQREEIEKYLKYVESRSEVDRMAEVKKITGAFTGAYAINPFNGNQIPIWISEYVLAGYGTGAIMAVPCGDERDHKFAKHFNLPITNIIGSHYNGEEANPTKDAILENSGFLNGMVMRDAIDVAINELEKRDIGKKQVNYKMRDAGWSRQRYWGEPFPVVYKDDVPYAMKESELPLELPPSNNFKPSGNGEGPLANLTDWINFTPDQKHDSNTMPTHAGAAWYFLRYMDPHNTKEFAGKEALDYWNQVDVYIGGSEHAVAHLLYARLWTKVLHDLGYLKFDEPFKKLINQGKITGDSRFVYRINFPLIQQFTEATPNRPLLYVSKNIADKILKKEFGEKEYSEIQNKFQNEFSKLNPGINWLTSFYGLDEETFLISRLHVPIDFVDGDYLNIEKFRAKNIDYKEAVIICDADGRYLCDSAIEKMSKSYYNVVNPDAIIENYGADTLRMYEMFLGPLEASKPWSTQGIDGVFKFLRRFWNLFHDSAGNFKISEAEPTREELKVLHKTLKKIEQDIENFSFNTSVSEFMICANELSSLKCNKRSILEPLVVALAPFAPYIAEELWEKLGHTETILKASFPKFDEQYLTESSFDYPISINGKVRLQMNFALDMPKEDIEKAVLASEAVIKWTEGKQPKKMIVVQGRIVNVVL